MEEVHDAYFRPPSEEHPALADGDSPSRSIDDYLESAYGHARHRRGVLHELALHWRYYIIFLALGIANSGDSAEMGVTNYILSSDRFQQDILGGGDEGGEGGEIDFGGRGAFIAGAHFSGMLVSGLLSGVLADILGRRSTLLAGLMLNSVVGLLAALARNATELCLLRFLCGIGLGMVIAGVVTMAAELSPPTKRGRFMTLVASCYTLGFLYTAFWALIIFRVSGSGSWRLFMIMNALPTMIAATLVTKFVPESPRFFLCRGRLREAVHISNVIASRIGYADELLSEDELTHYLFQAKRIGRASIRAKETISLNESDNSPIPIAEDKWREVWASLASMKQVFVKGMYRRTIPLQLTYFSLTLVTGVATWWTKIFQNLELQTDAYALSFYHTLAQVPGMLLASGLIDWVGRRRLVIIGFGGGFATLLVLSTLATTIQSNGGGGYYSILVLAVACFYTVSLCVAWLSLDCLSAESFPTKIRSTGRGVCVATGRLAGFCVQFTYGPLISQNRLSYMLGLASLFAVGGVVASCRTTDTTNIDLQDHWEYADDGSNAKEGENGTCERTGRRASFAEATHSKYFSVEAS
ncbi:hypothetical protein ACHAXT_002316 [Thalassiosira profunda]